MGTNLITQAASRTANVNIPVFSPTTDPDVDTANANLHTLEEQIMVNNNDAQNQTKIIVEAQNSAAQQQDIIDTAKLTADLHGQQVNQRVAASFGVNPDDQGFAINHLADQAQQAYAQMEKTMQIIQQKQNVSFFDDPVGWINAKMTINSDIEQYNTAEAARDGAIAQAEKLNQAFQSQSITDAALKQPVTTASIAAASQLQADKAAIAAAQAVREGAKIGNEGIMSLANLDEHRLNNMFNASQLKLAKQAQEIGLARLSMEREMFSWKMEEKQDEDAAYKEFVTRINQGIDAAGGAAGLKLAEDSKLGKDMFRAIRAGKSPMDQRYMQYYMLGATGTFGGAPAQALQSVTTLNPNLPPAAKATADFLKDVKTGMPAGMVAPGTPKEEVIKQEASRYNTIVAQELDTQAKNVTTDGNLYYPGSMRTIIENAAQSPKLSAWMKNSPVVQQVLLPAIQSGQDLSTPALTLAAVQDALKNKKISFPDALDVVTLYQHGVSVNNKARGFLQFGIPENNSYNTKVPSSGLGNTTLNVTDQVQVARYLVNRGISEDLSDVPMGLFGPAIDRGNAAISGAVDAINQASKVLEPTAYGKGIKGGKFPVYGPNAGK
jgi:hypothetical protein